MDREEITPLHWRDDALALLDQTRLPAEEIWLRCTQPVEVGEAIRRLSVRGAPAIGVAAAYGLVLGLSGPGESDLRADFESAVRAVSTRPTAVNLRWAVERGERVFSHHEAQGRAACRSALLAWAKDLHAADFESNRRMGEYGATLFAPGSRILTHCNTGALATTGIGTALGVIRTAHAQGRVSEVFADETRPLLQGARLTAWELEHLGIPYRVITDSSAGALMARGMIDAVIVGADRIAANGDTANKIGTYTLAVLARHHGLPFYVAAPVSTIDPGTANGDAIPIEERDPGEVTTYAGTTIAPRREAALNFAFDVTPNGLIAAIVTDQGVLRAPFDRAIEALKS
ncbi:MAG: S-methyl-5-thioribose-1-phosphate isomerase [Acidobacteriota bacterium]